MDEKVKHDNAETEFKHWLICERFAKPRSSFTLSFRTTLTPGSQC